MLKRIIIADDKKSHIISLSEWVKNCCEKERINVEITGVDDGIPLVEKVLSEHWDLVFTDNRMLRMNGVDAVYKIREKDKLTPIYLICIGDSVTELRAVDAGVTGYIHRLDPNCWNKITMALYRHLA